MYKLRYHDISLLEFINYSVLNANIETLDSKRLINYITSIVYFKVDNLELYNTILPHITRHLTTLGKEGITQLKIIELALRLSESSLHLFQLLCDFKDVVEEYKTSKLQKEVGEISLNAKYRLNSEVKIGPFMVDFATPLTAKDMYNSYNSYDDNNVINSDGVIIEVDGPHHFYKNTRIYTCHSILKSDILQLMGYRVIRIKYYEWNKLGHYDKEKLLQLYVRNENLDTKLL